MRIGSVNVGDPPMGMISLAVKVLFGITGEEMDVEHGNQIIGLALKVAVKILFQIVRYYAGNATNRHSEMYLQLEGANNCNIYL